MLDNDSESNTLAPGGDFFYQEGPTVYRSRTVFEDATPELVRDFFWDDEFRPKWDPMLAYFKILEECPHTGRMIVHWIKKVCCINHAKVLSIDILFPFFYFDHSLSEKRFTSPICSSHFSAVIENISLVEEYGMLGRHIIV